MVRTFCNVFSDFFYSFAMFLKSKPTKGIFSMQRTTLTNFVSLYFYSLKFHKIPISFLFCIITSLVNYSAESQSVEYHYDLAGNRISRTIINLPSNVNKQKLDTVMFSIFSSNTQIRVYPNPTLGDVRVNIPKVDSEDDYMLNLYNAKGVLLQSLEVKSGENSVQMREYQPGWYFLRLILADQIKEFKIIKK